MRPTQAARKVRRPRANSVSPQAIALRADTAKLLRLLKARLLKAFGERLVTVIIFGSMARGDARPDSDIDLLVVIERPLDLGLDLFSAIGAIYPLQLKLDRCIHTVTASRDAFEASDYPLYSNARREGLAA